MQTPIKFNLLQLEMPAFLFLFEFIFFQLKTEKNLLGRDKKKKQKKKSSGRWRSNKQYLKLGVIVAHYHKTNCLVTVKKVSHEKEKNSLSSVGH